MYPTYSGGWGQPYPYYNSAYGGYPYNQSYGYPPVPSAAPPPPPGTPFYGYQPTRPSFYPTQLPNYVPQQQVNPAPALTFEGFNSEDTQKIQQTEKQRLVQFASKGAPTLKGKPAKDFFEHAVGVQRPTLKRIWSIADVNHQGELDRQDFFIALRLIAIAQRGSDPSVYSLQRFAGMQLIPDFKWETGTGESFSEKNTSQRTSPQTANNMKKDESSYKITEEQKAYYDQTFAELDWAHSSYISFSQANDYFSQSGLADHLIQRILKLSDISADEKNWITSNGEQLPSELPYSLALELNAPAQQTSSKDNPMNYDVEALRSHLSDAKLETDKTKRKIQEIQEKLTRLRSEKKVLQDQIKSYDTEIQQIRSQMNDVQANYYVETSFFPSEMETRRMNGGTNMNPNNKNVNSNNGMQDPSGQPSDLPPPPSYDEIMDSQGKSGMNNPSTGSAATPSPPTSDKSGKAGNFSIFSNVFSRRASEKKNQ
ncbi:Epidermal growth factor receptor substrate 15 [Galdieria sulphuraria]|nr:Epidermal growth factor receptor substrate 15 [Galdieria sulphuraria]